MVRRTVADVVTLSGRGVHTGALGTVVIRPDDTGSGIVFHAGGQRIPADVHHVVDTVRCTTLGAGAVRISTVEHLLAAFAGLGVTDVEVLVDGPEIPALDGGAADIVRALTRAGFRALGPYPAVARIIRPGTLHVGRAVYSWEPAEDCLLSATITLPPAAGGEQTFSWRVDPVSFSADVAPAKTFCLHSEIEAVRAAGLGRGGSARTVLILGEAGVVNPEIQTFDDECARHKVLDLLGDLSLLGMPLRGRIRAVAPGHAGNVQLVKRLMHECVVERRSSEHRGATP